MKFCAHLDMFFPELPMAERLKRFAELGFDSFELWCHWEYELDKLAAESRHQQLQVAALATAFIPLTDKNRHEEYLKGLKESIAACRMLDCPLIISQVGNLQSDSPREHQTQYIINGLRMADRLLKDTGITLVVEPLNVLVDHPGYFLTRSDDAAAIVEAVGSEHVKMLFDVYHQQISEGNLINNIRRYLPLIGHFHVADNPGRKQPGTGEINYENIFKAIDESGFCGRAGLEFSPQGDTRTVLREFLAHYVQKQEGANDHAAL